MSIKSNKLSAYNSLLTANNDDNMSMSSNKSCVSSNQNAEIIAAAFAPTNGMDYDTNSDEIICDESSDGRSIDTNVFNNGDDEDNSKLSIQTNTSASSIDSNRASCSPNVSFELSEEALSLSPAKKKPKISKPNKKAEAKSSSSLDDIISSVVKKSAQKKTKKAEPTVVDKVIDSVIKKNQTATKSSTKNELNKKFNKRRAKLDEASRAASNKSKPTMNQKIGATIPTTSTNLKYLLKRQCIICKAKVHQDSLNDHCSEHFSESAKCSSCDKISTNPSNFVTHILSHLPTQFFCVGCEKWFRQPIAYKRHRAECQQEGGAQSSSRKRKNTVSSESSVEPAKRAIKLEPSAEQKVKVKREKVELSEAAQQQQRGRGRPPKIKIKIKKENELDEEDVALSVIKKEIVNSNKKLSHVELKKKKKNKKKNGKNLRRKETKNYNENDSFDEILEEIIISDEMVIGELAVKVEPTSNGKQRVQTKSKEKKQVEIKKETKPVVRVEPIDKKNKKLNRLDSVASSATTEDEMMIKQKTKESASKSVTEIKKKYTQLSKNKLKSEKKSTSARVEAPQSSKTSALPAAVAESKTTTLEVRTTKDLISFGTYKVKIQKRKPSSAVNKESSSGETSGIVSESVFRTPNKSANIISSILTHTTASPSFLSSSLTALLSKDKDNAANSNVTHTYECPECDKKFVSYYGLVQHYDQHPKLKVTCVLCEITFDSHHLLVEHNKNVHQLDENGQDRDKEKWVFYFFLLL
jgi:hypothetical protein